MTTISRQLFFAAARQNPEQFKKKLLSERTTEQKLLQCESKNNATLFPTCSSCKIVNNSRVVCPTKGRTIWFNETKEFVNIAEHRIRMKAIQEDKRKTKEATRKIDEKEIQKETRKRSDLAIAARHQADKIAIEVANQRLLRLTKQQNFRR